MGIKRYFGKTMSSINKKRSSTENLQVTLGLNDEEESDRGNGRLIQVQERHWPRTGTVLTGLENRVPKLHWTKDSRWGC